MRPIRSKLLRRLVAIFLLGALSACVSPTQNITEPRAWEQALSSGKQSVVIGRIEWLEHGKARRIGKGLTQFSVTPMLLRMEDKSRTKGELDENGAFIWALQPGTYVIYRINYRDPWSGNYFMVPKVAFRVPETGKIYYVGTLRADFASKRDIIGGLSGLVKVSVEDRSQRGGTALAEGLGMPPKEVQTSLMVHDAKLPRTIDTTAEFNLAVQILNAIGFGLSH